MELGREGLVCKGDLRTGWEVRRQPEAGVPAAKVGSR